MGGWVETECSTGKLVAHVRLQKCVLVGNMKALSRMVDPNNHTRRKHRWRWQNRDVSGANSRQNGHWPRTGQKRGKDARAKWRWRQETSSPFALMNVRHQVVHAPTIWEHVKADIDNERN